MEVARLRFDYTRVADDMASMLRADITSGVNGTCGTPVPQVFQYMSMCARKIVLFVVPHVSARISAQLLELQPP